MTGKVLMGDSDPQVTRMLLEKIMELSHKIDRLERRLKDKIGSRFANSIDTCTYDFNHQNSIYICTFCGSSHNYPFMNALKDKECGPYEQCLVCDKKTNQVTGKVKCDDCKTDTMEYVDDCCVIRNEWEKRQRKQQKTKEDEEKKE